MPQPNIILIVADCARSDKWLGPSRPTKTPNLDRLTAAGVALPTTIVEKSCTTPSFSTLLTARYSPRHGVHLVWGYRLPANIPLLPEQFAAAGYNTYAEVSGPLLPEMGLARGFQHYEYRAPCDLLNNAWGESFRRRLRSGYYKPPFFMLLHLWELHPHRCVPPEFDKPEFGRDEYERAVSHLDHQLGELFASLPQPTLVAFTGDHGEKTRFERYLPNTAVDYAMKLLRVEEADGLAPYNVAGFAGPSVLQELYSRSTPAMRDMNARDWRPPQSTRWTRLRDSLRLLKFTPFVYFHDLLALGSPLKLTQMLKRRKLLDENAARKKVDRFASSIDRAALLDMHMRMWINSYKKNIDEGHMVHVYDFLVKVPLVLSWLGDGAPAFLKSGRSIPHMVRQPDILPTLLEIAGIEATTDSSQDGRSFRALLEDRPWESSPAFLSVSGLPRDLELRGVRTETHKFTYCPHNPDLPAELYDLTADPHEQNNLAKFDSRRCAELRALADQLAAGEIRAEEMTIANDGERAGVETRLRELGYLA